MDQPPPPPPPHGENPKTTNGAGGGLGPGNYDIFVIPQRDKGGGFIYLPAMNANGPSFAAGFASALILVVIFQSIAPAFQAWWSNFEGMGTTGMFTLILAVGLVAWAMGQWQAQAAPANGASGAGGPYGGASPGANAGAAPNAGSAPPPPPRNDPPPNHNGSAGNPPPKSSWQQPPPGSNTRSEEPPPQSAPPPPQPSAWERARQETKRKEEERKKKEEEEKRKAEAARRLREFREKEAREREKREREARERKEKAEKEEKEKEELKKKLEKETAERERLEKEKAEREAKEKEEARKKELEEKRKQEAEERKKREAEAAARTARQGSTYAYSGVGEKTSPWPKGTNPPPPPSSAPRSTASPTKPARSTASTDKSGRPPAPSARTHLGDDDAYSYRPYDQPKKAHRRAPSSIGSESSWAPSATTARTTPPPSMRGPYSTKDPDKIVIKAVYLFMNQFAKTPASNLLSGVGSVTDGLILRVTTAGLFIDDDVRGVPQREWDVKAWTLKSVEVWCPPHCLFAPASSASGSNPNQPSSFLHKMAASQFGRQADRSASKTFVGDDADVYLNELLRTCRECCRLGLCDGKLRDTNASTSAGQTGQWKARGLHLLRATVKDQEGKRYLVVLDDEEAWKLSAGLQRLRKGTQARTLNVSGMSASDARGTLDMLGWLS